MSLAIGDVLNGRYRVDALLGQGGMGAVYRAWDLNLKMDVALKENNDTSAEGQRQFEREATILSRLNHANLPRVTDHFFVPGRGQYLVMDYVAGEDLETMVGRVGALPQEQALAWVSQVCDALAYLHSQPQPIIHRDIKPANIRIAHDGRAMLVDFGISKLYDPDSRTTVAAKAITPGYSPPEQYGGGITDTRSDLYALGATLYHLLTGRLPPESIKRMVGDADVTPPQVLNHAISPAVGQVVLAAMALPTSQRFQNAAALKAALTTRLPAVEPPPAGRWSTAPPPAMPEEGPLPEPRGRRGVPVAAALGVLLLLLATVGGYLLARGGSGREEVTLPTESADSGDEPEATSEAVAASGEVASPTAAVVPSKTAEGTAAEGAGSATALAATDATIAAAAATAVMATALAAPPTITPIPPPTVAPAPSATPRCPLVEGPFADVWLAYEERLGCAIGQPAGHSGADEVFEMGLMFWRSDAIDYGQALVAFNNGTWRIFQHAPFVEGSPDFACTDAYTPAECPPTPKRGFGMMWCDSGEIRSGLGNAVECEQAYSGTQQTFQYGFILRSRSGTFVFLNDHTWQRY